MGCKTRRGQTGQWIESENEHRGRDAVTSKSLWTVPLGSTGEDVAVGRARHGDFMIASAILRVQYITRKCSGTGHSTCPLFSPPTFQPPLSAAAAARVPCRIRKGERDGWTSVDGAYCLDRMETHQMMPRYAPSLRPRHTPETGAAVRSVCVQQHRPPSHTTKNETREGK